MIKDAGQVTGQEAQAVALLFAEPRTANEIQETLGIRRRETFQRNYLWVLLKEEILERTIPDKPTSRLQRYRLTARGRARLAAG